ncbi:hypothetical protein Psesu_1174 [Pseudoxanthomonas suwonensis 11-1]|uniref:Peptidase M15A C-terminal domain-containing protein n=1 Tax=Pseudoxanthomonas suwonensis (strain 11-1) TaxID=743721 RepID=E6WS74_PSEUU|nr:hypothetical protein [Pseudoxanthomonas suwonensis]ADV27023.1 hypothetical protein Psesu_1174 [Pseudoxanthomonas suwonensis 11-1]
MATNAFAAFVQGQQAGQQARAYQQQQEDRNALRTLAPQILAGDVGAFTQAAAIDPKAATAVQDAGDGQLRRLRGALDYFGQALESGDDRVIQARFKEISPFLSRVTGNPAPPAWTEEMRPAFEQARQRVSMAPAGAGEAEPTQFRALHMQALAAGHKPGTDGYRDFFRRANGEIARQSSAAIQYKEITGPDGRTYLVATDPREIGATTIGGGPSFGSFAGPVQGQPSAPAPAAGTPAQPSGGDPFATLHAAVPGLRVTSQTRTPEENARLPNAAPNSHHLTGNALDIGTPTPEQQAGIRQWAAQNGYEVINNYQDGHWHLEPARQGRAPAPAAPDRLLVSDPVNGGLVGGGNPFASRRPEDQAAATEAAKLGVQLEYAPQVAAAEAEAARAKKLAEAGAEREAQAPKRIASYRQALQAAGNVETSLKRALEMIGPTSTGFVGARLRGVEGSPSYNLAAEIETVKANLGFDRLQQMRDNSPTGGALGAIAIQELIALQSTIANLDPNQSAEQLRTNLGRVQQHYANWRSAVEQALAEEERGGAGQQQASAANLTRVQSAADYQALAPGAEYIAPDGSLRRKR